MSNITVIAGKRGKGKTTESIKYALNAAKEGTDSVLFVSGDMFVRERILEINNSEEAFKLSQGELDNITVVYFDSDDDVKPALDFSKYQVIILDVTSPTLQHPVMQEYLHYLKQEENKNLQVVVTVQLVKHFNETHISANNLAESSRLFSILGVPSDEVKEVLLLS